MLPVPHSILVAGLVGVGIALVVATATQRWQLRVFVLLALRLAIGWHFLFEGLHKIHSRHVGLSETTKPFTSEPYFTIGEGPAADFARKKYLGDPEKTYTDRLTQPTPMTAAEFMKLSLQEQAQLCPKAVEDGKDGLIAAANAALPELEAKLAEARAVPPVATPVRAAEDTDEAWKVREAEWKEKEFARKLKIDEAKQAAEAARDDGRELRAAYAAWVYGAAGHTAKIKYVSGDVSLTGPQRLHHIAMLQADLTAIDDRDALALGRGDGHEVGRAKTARTDLLAAKADLAKDSEAVINDLRKRIGAKPLPAPEKEELKEVDRFTAIAITAIGAGLLLGLFTPVWCLAGFGFLAMTYLSTPPWPWLSPPPPSEGNPLFINKNLIEALGLLVVAAHPTGRWLGLDALWTWLVFRPKPTADVA